MSVGHNARRDTKTPQRLPHNLYDNDLVSKSEEKLSLIKNVATQGVNTVSHPAMQELLKRAKKDVIGGPKRDFSKTSSQRKRGTETSRSENREIFIPYLNERDHMGKLI